MLELSSSEMRGLGLPSPAFAASPSSPSSAACSRGEERELEGKARQRLLGRRRAGWAGRALRGMLGVDGLSLSCPDAGLPVSRSSRAELLQRRCFPFPNPGKPPVPAVLDKQFHPI